MNMSRRCANCDKSFVGRFCPECGQKVIIHDDRKVVYFFGELLAALTFADNKFWRSLRAIILHPGLVSSEISRGVTVKYMKPISFFLLGNLLYFLFPVFETFNTKLTAQMEMLSYSQILNLSDVVNERISEAGTTLSEFREDYQIQSTTVSKLMLIVIVPIFALLTAIVAFDKRKLFFDHLIFSLEYFSFVIFVCTVFLSYLLIGISVFIKLNWNDTILIPIIFVLATGFLIRGVRRFYQYSWWRSIITGLGLFVATYLSLEIYRLLLFWVTIWTM